MAGGLKFNFALSVDAQAGDQVDDLRDQLAAAGHQFAVSREFLPPPWFNLFAEGTSEATPERVAKLARVGYQFVVLVTEHPTLVTAEGLVWNHRTSTAWTARADAFVEAAPHFAAAWCYSPGGAGEIRRFVPRAAQVDMAWGARFLRPRRPVEPTHDFCFFGSLTPRRAKVVAALARKHSVDVIPHETSLVQRDARIPHSRVVLDIKQYHWWDLASSVRYATALLCGRPVVAEARSERAKGAWGSIVEFAEEGAFLETASAVLQNWPQQRGVQTAALRARKGDISAAVAVLPEPLSGPTGEVPRFAPALPPAKQIDPPTLIDSVRGMNLVRWNGAILAVPQALGAIHVDKVDLSRYPSIRAFEDREAALRAVK